MEIRYPSTKTYWKVSIDGVYQYGYTDTNQVTTSPFNLVVVTEEEYKANIPDIKNITSRT